MEESSDYLVRKSAEAITQTWGTIKGQPVRYGLKSRGAGESYLDVWNDIRVSVEVDERKVRLFLENSSAPNAVERFVDYAKRTGFERIKVRTDHSRDISDIAFYDQGGSLPERGAYFEISLRRKGHKKKRNGDDRKELLRADDRTFRTLYKGAFLPIFGKILEAH